MEGHTWTPAVDCRVSAYPDSGTEDRKGIYGNVSLPSQTSNRNQARYIQHSLRG